MLMQSSRRLRSVSEIPGKSSTRFEVIALPLLKYGVVSPSFRPRTESGLMAREPDPTPSGFVLTPIW